MFTNTTKTGVQKLKLIFIIHQGQESLSTNVISYLQGHFGTMLPNYLLKMIPNCHQVLKMHVIGLPKSRLAQELRCKGDWMHISWRHMNSKMHELQGTSTYHHDSRGFE